MNRLLIFGGTTEGRNLAEFCAAAGIPVTVSVTTAYGAALLPECVQILTGRLDAAEMRHILVSGKFTHVVDATHPYAAEATTNIRSACQGAGVSCVRLVRESADISGIAVHDTQALTEELNTRDGVILSTLGSKLLPALTAVRDFRERLWVRVLPTENITEYCEKLGYAPSHVIAERPPFSVARNLAHIRRCGAETLVTKESGSAGGYPEKCEAAKISGITLVTLCRAEEQGLNLDSAKKWLREVFWDAC